MIGTYVMCFMMETLCRLEHLQPWIFVTLFVRQHEQAYNLGCGARLLLLEQFLKFHLFKKCILFLKSKYDRITAGRAVTCACYPHLNISRMIFWFPPPPFNKKEKNNNKESSNCNLFYHQKIATNCTENSIFREHKNIQHRVIFVWFRIWHQY